MLRDQSRESVVNLFQAKFESFARRKPDGAGGEADERAAFPLDHAEAGVFASTIHA
jgi:hypothetical protein